MSTYSLASRSVSGRGAASVTGDVVCVSKCWIVVFVAFIMVDDREVVAAAVFINGNTVPGGGGRLREKLALA